MEQWLVKAEELLGHLVINHVFRSAEAEKTGHALLADLQKIRQDVTGTAPAATAPAPEQGAAPGQPAPAGASDAG